MEKMYDGLVIHEIFKQVSSGFPGRVCIQIKKGSEWEKWTYQDVEDLSLRISAFFVQEGFVRGDCVAICLENRPEWPAVYLGITRAGLTCVPLDPQLTSHEIETLLKDCHAKIIFVSQNIYQEKVFDKQRSHLNKIVVVDGDLEKSDCISLEQITRKAYDDVKWPQVSCDDVASLIYTSGTTGIPKGVMLTHRNFCSNFQSIDKLKLVTDKDNLMSVLPLHHAYPFMVTLLVPLLCRARITYISSLKSEELLSCMRETGVTVLVGVPQLFYMFYTRIADQLKAIPFFVRMPLLGTVGLLERIKKISGVNFNKAVLAKVHRLFGKRLRFFACGGAKLNEEAGRFLTKIGFTILEGYGLTETSPVVTFNPAAKQKIGSVGKVLPDIEVRIDSPDAEGAGEVAIKGPNVMKGYYKHKAETASVLKEDWFYSGDLGRVDKDGYLYITGRKKEVIVLSSGKNIFPEEIEAHYTHSSFVKEMCVFGAGKGEEEKLVAVIVPDMDHCRKVGEINLYRKIKWELENLSEQVPVYRRVRGFVVAKEDLPRTRLGKIKRFEVKDRYLDELVGMKEKEAQEEDVPTDEDLSLLSSPVGKVIIDVLNKEVTMERSVRLDDHLELDLGIDSLGRVEVIAALEGVFKTSIPDDLTVKIFTVRDLILEVEKLVLSEGGAQNWDARVQVQGSVWDQILKRKLPDNMMKKIDLSPGCLAKMWTLMVSGFLRILFQTVWQMKIVGVENIPKKGPFLLCPNHGSYLDGFLVAAAMSRPLRKDLFFIGYRAYFEVFFVRNIIKFIRVIPVDPATHLVEAMQASAYVLREGKAVCIFPEGERSIDGEVKEFKKGVGILAQELGVPLVPVYIDGSYEAWPRTKKFPRPYPVEITFGKPLDEKDLKAAGSRLGAQDDYQAIASGVREEVVRLKKPDA
ncbi:MAG: AMP-binding protein [Candidatus Omnitrophica bacterium]|nr:AMP-binding protein [Candidatus Omnitrophota bacterium]